ncbi:MAG TPA: hypothetical protein VM266_00785, partial [Solirubrobacteraceae bacterium]|nr:hypothetical protein [Solirubrobacteraceae bacterium]
MRSARRAGADAGEAAQPSATRATQAWAASPTPVALAVKRPSAPATAVAIVLPSSPLVTVRPGPARLGRAGERDRVTFPA